VQLFVINVNQETQNANNLLDVIMEKFEALEDGQGNNFSVQGIEDWYLVGWSKNEEGRPERCFFNTCLCICPRASSESCQDKRICRDIAKENIDVFGFVGESTADIGSAPQISVATQIFENPRFSCIKLPKNLFELEIIKEKNSLSVGYINKETMWDLGGKNTACFGNRELLA
jgi:hypothetical protein